MKDTKFKKNLLLVAIISTIIVIFDQITKNIISKNLILGQEIQVIKNFFYISYTTNTGAGFGILQNLNSILIWVTLAIVGIIIYNYDKIPRDKIPQVMIAFILGGAVGNLISRIYLGHVIDFISFAFWPSFNIADSFITIGAVGLIIYFWKK